MLYDDGYRDAYSASIIVLVNTYQYLRIRPEHNRLTPLRPCQQNFLRFSVQTFLININFGVIENVIALRAQSDNGQTK